MDTKFRAFQGDEKYRYMEIFEENEVRCEMKFWQPILGKFRYRKIESRLTTGLTILYTKLGTNEKLRFCYGSVVCS